MSKKFKTFYDSLDNYPAFEDATGNQKANAYKSFQVRGAFKPPAGYTLSSEEFLKKVGLKKSTLDTYVADPNKNNTSRLGKNLWVKNNLNPKPRVNFAYSADKQRYANENSILIDDKKSNIKEWIAKGGIAFRVKGGDIGPAIQGLKELGYE